MTRDIAVVLMLVVGAAACSSALREGGDSARVTPSGERRPTAVPAPVRPVPGEAAAPAAPPGDAADTKRDATPAHRSQAVGVAMKYRGVPYRWGGASPAGFDCSGFVMYVYQRVGISLPHHAVKQYAYGTPVSRDHLKPGDLVFFDRLRHNGIYVGRGQFIHAGKNGDAVKVSGLDEPWFKRRRVGGRRL